jgi:hypothetical protein
MNRKIIVRKFRIIQEKIKVNIKIKNMKKISFRINIIHIKIKIRKK